MKSNFQVQANSGPPVGPDWRRAHQEACFPPRHRCSLETQILRTEMPAPGRMMSRGWIGRLLRSRGKRCFMGPASWASTQCRREACEALYVPCSRIAGTQNCATVRRLRMMPLERKMPHRLNLASKTVSRLAPLNCRSPRWHIIPGLLRMFTVLSLLRLQYCNYVTLACRSRRLLSITVQKQRRFSCS